MNLAQSEPVMILGCTEAAINAVQVAAIPMPTWAHTAIAVGSIVIGSILARLKVIPVSKASVNPDDPYQ